MASPPPTDTASGLPPDLPLPTLCAILRAAHEVMGKSASTAPNDEEEEEAERFFSQSPSEAPPPPEDNVEADILEDRGPDTDATEDDLFRLIDDLDHPAQIDLVALMWLGRDEDEDWQSLHQIASAEHTDKTAHYLMGTPRLAEYLATGMERLGLECGARAWEEI